MGWKSKVTAVVFMTLGAVAVSGSATAQSACRNICDDNHVTCMQAGKSDGAVCLPAWLQCKTACTNAAAKPAATPVAMTSKPPPKH